MHLDLRTLRYQYIYKSKHLHIYRSKKQILEMFKYKCIYLLNQTSLKNDCDFFVTLILLDPITGSSSMALVLTRLPSLHSQTLQWPMKPSKAGVLLKSENNNNNNNNNNSSNNNINININIIIVVNRRQTSNNKQ